MNKMLNCLQIRSYEIRENSADLFETIFTQQVLPLLKEWQTRVVFAGWSSEDSGSFVLMRAYDDINQLRKSQDEFYSSAQWREGPRDAMLEQIVMYVTITIELSSDCLARMEQELAGSCLGERG